MESTKYCASKHRRSAGKRLSHAATCPDQFMIDPVDIPEDDPRIKEVAEILLAAGERGVYSAARAAIAWHENEVEKNKHDRHWDGLGV